MQEGVCLCGCGQKTRLAYRNDKERGWIKGKPIFFINHHAWKGKKHTEKTKQKLSILFKKRITSIDKHPAWKGGTRICQGYLYINEPTNPNAEKSGYVKRCVRIMQSIIGRPLKKWDEVIHHIDNNRMNDSPHNLLLCSRGEHNTLHSKKKGENYV